MVKQSKKKSGAAAAVEDDQKVGPELDMGEDAECDDSDDDGDCDNRDVNIGTASPDADQSKGGDYSRAAAAALPPVRLAVPSSCCGMRLDVVLATLLPEHSRSRLQGWIRDGRVSVDGKRSAEPKIKLEGFEKIDLQPALSPDANAHIAEAIDFPVIYEDDDIVIIDKPAGLVVHPGSGNWSGTLMNGLLHRYPETAGLPRAGIVHRLDKDTSGLMVVARTLTAQTDLVRQLQARTVKRQYLAVAIGMPLRESDVIEAPIGRHPTQRIKMAVIETGKPARTRFRLIEVLKGAVVLHCDLDTGRTHQIRVHMAWLKLPLVGDPLYLGRMQGPKFHRQALHARKLGLVHPATGKPMEWGSPLPDDLADLIESLREPIDD